MDFLNYEFDATPNDVIEVTLDRAANVQLLDPSNYEAYRNKRAYHYWGGHATRSPIILKIPHPGHWHVVIDLGGGAGQVRAAARLVAGAAA